MLIKQISSASCTYIIMRELYLIIFSAIVKITTAKTKKKQKNITRYKTFIGTNFL